MVLNWRHLILKQDDLNLCVSQFMEIFGKICLETDSSPNVQLKVYHKRDRTHLNFRNITGLKSETELSYLII